MTTKIEILGIKFYAYHGVMPQERTVGNYFTVDLTFTAPLAQAMESDDLHDTISYADVYQLIAKDMQIPSNLLEHVGGRILKALRKEYPTIGTIDLRITKHNPPIPGEVPTASFVVHDE